MKVDVGEWQQGLQRKMEAPGFNHIKYGTATQLFVKSFKLSGDILQVLVFKVIVWHQAYSDFTIFYIRRKFITVYFIKKIVGRAYTGQ